ncbi:MAG: ComF family protein [Hyphomicrobiaceae bacterium]|nr:ComF family protein [Hyphomicrobiaceae bacterium]
MTKLLVERVDFARARGRTAPGEGAPPDDAGGAAGFIAGVRRLSGAVADLIMPPACSACQRRIVSHHALCAACWREVAFIRAPLCDVTGMPLPFDTGGRMVSARALAQPPAYDRARAVARHEGAMRRLVHQFKYADRHEARPLFGRWLREAGHELLGEADVIVPVPMGRLRLVLRRYNQAAMLATELSRTSGVPAALLALRRVKRTPRQVGLSRAQRIENVAGAFAVAPGRRAEIAGKRVLLVDDVITTGATADACARVLKRAGAARVDVLALAMVCDAVLLTA